MSAPERIYIIDEDIYDSPDPEELPSWQAVSTKLNPNLKYVEYVLAPAAKKFSEVKPKQACACMCHDNDGAGWYFGLFNGKHFIDIMGDIFKPKFWCEIILPKLPD